MRSSLRSDDESGMEDNESDDLRGTIPPGEDHCKSDGKKEGNAEGEEEDDDEECSSNDDEADDLDNDGKVGDMDEVNVDMTTKKMGMINQTTK